MKFRVFIEQDEDDVFVAHCPSLLCCFFQGKTRIEAQANINDAVEGYMESLAKHSETENHPH
jgi:antitoxin HicB